MVLKFKRIWQIQNSINKRKVLTAVALLFFSSILDLIGVASVLPFLLSLSDPNIIQNNNLLLKLNSFLMLETNEFIIFLGISSFFLIVLNQLLRLFSKWYSLALSENLLFENSRDLFHYYLKKPYEFFLDKNNAHLLQRCTNYVNSTVGGYITPSLLIFGNFLTGSLVFLFLIIYNTKITIIILLSLTIFYFLFFNQIKKKISKFSKAIPKHYSNTAKTIGDAFGSIKETIMFDNSKFFVNRFINTAENYKNAHIKLNLVNQLPNTFVEIFSYGLLLSIFLLLFLFSDNFYEIIPLLGITALSLRRLLPAAQDIYVQLLLVKFYKETYKKIIVDLENSFKFQKKIALSHKKNNTDIVFKKNIKFEKIKYFYKSKIKNKFAFETKIDKGEFIGICGMSGHGKTTFLDLFCGLLKKKSGKILIDNTELDESYTDGWKKKISYVPQTGYLLNDTLRNNIIFGSKLMNNTKKLSKILKIVELHNFLSENKYNYSTKIGEDGVRLSGGQQQRLILARALYKEPQILVLDEATSALDLVTSKKVISNIRKYLSNTTIIFVSHRVETLEKSDKILLFRNGIINYEGKYNSLRKNKYFKKLILEKNN